MSVKLKISVTKEILEKTAQCNSVQCFIPENCAIAVAVRDIFPRARVYARGHTKFFGEGRWDYTYDFVLPEVAVSFISDFDCFSPEDRRLMMPISFEIDIPDEVINQINIDEIRPLLTNHPTLELIEQ